jgi:hypothetical protein
LVAAVAIVLSLSLKAAPAAAAGVVLETEACRVDLTTGLDDFQITLIYQVVVGDDGRATRLDPVRKDDMAFAARRVHLDQFDQCMKRWRFASPGVHVLIFTLGTVGESLKSWTISVSHNREAFQLVIPRLPER